jgi:hypothetical protein
VVGDRSFIPEEPLRSAEPIGDANVENAMKNDLDILAVAAQLVREMGDDAVRVSRVRLVELIAANNPRAADFWRSVLQQCEIMLAQSSGSMAESVKSNQGPASLRALT